MVKCAVCGKPQSVSKETGRASKWLQMRDQQAGWFFGRGDNDSFCPEHIPDWVAEWRERQRQTKAHGDEAGN